MFKKIFGYFTGWKFFIFILAAAALKLIPLGDQFYFIKARFKIQVPYMLWVWGNYDGAHYLDIARRGYQDQEFGFFPLFPQLIYGLHSILKGSYIISALLISNISFFFALIVIYHLLKLDKKITLFNSVLIIILAFPTSMFYQALYNDSLFFFLACLTLYFGRRKQWVRASISGGLATLARLNGLALFFFILFEYLGSGKKLWTRNLRPEQILKNKIYSVLLIPSAFIGYLAYINIKSGSWFTLFSSMKEWHQDRFTFPPQVIWRYIKIFLTVSPSHFNFWVAVLEFGFVAFYVCMIVWSYKKIRLSYWVLFVLSILIPSMTGTFQGMPRYGLHLYPLFLSLALLFEHQKSWIRILYLTISIGLMFFYIGFFTRGYFVA